MSEQSSITAALESHDWPRGSLLLAMSPAGAWWCRRVDDQWTPVGETGANLLVGDAFEVIAFHSGLQLRLWLEDGVVRSAVIRCLDTCDGSGLAGTQLLWGTVGQVFNGAARLDDARIGSVWVPAPADIAEPSRTRRLQLRQHSCLATDDHGNRSPANTRWVCIESQEEGASHV